MVRVYAVVDPTQVVECQALRNWLAKVFIGKAMCQDLLASCDTEPPIPFLVKRTCPQPASRRIVRDETQKSDTWFCSRIAHMPVLTTLTVGRFIRELITGISPVSILLEEWSITHDDYMELRKTKVFRAELAAAVRDLQNQGPDAAYILRMKLLSEEFFGDIEKIVRDEMAPHSVKMDAIKFCAEMARLKPEKKDAAPAGTTVNFAFGGTLGKLLGVENVLEVKSTHEQHPSPQPDDSAARAAIERPPS